MNVGQPGQPTQGQVRLQHHAATRLGGSAPAALGSAFQTLRAAQGPDTTNAPTFAQQQQRPPWQHRPAHGPNDMDIDDDDDDSENDQRDDSNDMTDD